ncbi:hypothetical protein [Accumulibacter sp.]|uniref:hypothetical protein n=1 Tax=Accumulibacter sp. TaxID=2053492 RepID=UPI0004B8BAEC|nr:hypothetical protein [Accumulibacter sp.]HRE71029.1 hypothetical protein [Accumulibacter sp.]HRE86547.1 hypothetical protein [Accumulibacter sp.]
MVWNIGTLDFKGGAPSAATLDKVYDNRLYAHAFNAFVNTYQGVGACSPLASRTTR